MEDLNRAMVSSQSHQKDIVGHCLFPIDASTQIKIHDICDVAKEFRINLPSKYHIIFY